MPRLVAGVRTADQRGAITAPIGTDLREYLRWAKELLFRESPLLASSVKKEAEKVVQHSLLVLADLIRREFKAAQERVSRVELRELLNQTKAHSDRLTKLLSNTTLVEALELVRTAEPVRHRLHQLLQNREELIYQLRELADLMQPALTGLALGTRGGRSGAFQRIQLPPKVLLCVYARELFLRLRVTNRRPGAKNLKFIDFLESIWGLAVNPREAERDWSTPIKIAALKRLTGADESTHISTRIDATNFVRDLFRDLGRRGALTPPEF